MATLLTIPENNTGFAFMKEDSLSLSPSRSTSSLPLYLAAWSDMGHVPNRTDGKRRLYAVCPWPNLEKLCWAEPSTDLG